ncbi:MAG: GNAT family N-acetyltransferase [Sphingorhabdus sp.]
MIVYRAPELCDAEALAVLSRATFREAFAYLYCAEDLTLFESQVYAPEVIAAEIASPVRRYRIAEEAGCMIGYCKIGFDRTLDYDAGDKKIVELKQLYVFASHHGSGVARQLFDWVEAEARAAGADALLLSVYSDNPRGQRFYRKKGFTHVGDTYFMVGNQRDDEFLYLKSLR